MIILPRTLQTAGRLFTPWAAGLSTDILHRYTQCSVVIREVTRPYYRLTPIHKIKTVNIVYIHTIQPQDRARISSIIFFTRDPPIIAKAKGS